MNDWAPIAVGEVDVDSKHVRVFDADGAMTARLLVRRRREPIGFVTVPLRDGALTFDDVVSASPGILRGSDESHRPWPADEACPPISVVVCTRDRSSELARCLGAIQSVDYPAFEIVVVDNASTDDSTRHVVERISGADERVRLVEEPRPGLSRARNTGIAAARHDIVAFTDDDVLVDRWWLRAVARGFLEAANVGCVTGLVAAVELRTSAQWRFEQRVSWSAVDQARRVDLQESPLPSPLFPYAVGALGTGANMAFRRDVLLAVGGFDVALGAGTRSRGGEDLDMFVNVLLAGSAIAVEPAAVAWHRHRRDDAALDRQLYDYGLGLVAFLTKQATDPRRAVELFRRAPQGLARAAVLASRGRRYPGGDPTGPRWVEARGMVAGPVAYVRSRREALR